MCRSIAVAARRCCGKYGRLIGDRVPFLGRSINFADVGVDVVVMDRLLTFPGQLSATRSLSSAAASTRASPRGSTNSPRSTSPFRTTAVEVPTASARSPEPTGRDRCEHRAVVFAGSWPVDLAAQDLNRRRNTMISRSFERPEGTASRARPARRHDAPGWRDRRWSALTSEFQSA